MPATGWESWQQLMTQNFRPTMAVATQSRTVAPRVRSNLFSLFSYFSPCFACPAYQKSNGRNHTQAKFHLPHSTLLSVQQCTVMISRGMHTNSGVGEERERACACVLRVCLLRTNPLYVLESATQ